MEYNFLVDLDKKQKEIESWDDEKLLKAYKYSCYSGRSAPLGIDKNGEMCINAQYISILVSELKKRNLEKYIIKSDLNN